MLPRLKAAVLVLLAVPLLATCGEDPTGSGRVATALAVVTSPPVSVANGVQFTVEVRLVASGSVPVEQSGVIVTPVLLGEGRTLQGGAPVATDAEGVASFTALAILGAPGGVQLRFDAEGLESATTTGFGLTPGAITSIVVTEGNGQQTQVRTTPADPIRVRATDAGGNPIVGAYLTLQVIGGGGSLHLSDDEVTVRSIVTAINGVGTVGVWRTGPTVGTNTIRVFVTGTSTGPTATVTAATVPGPPSHPQVTDLIGAAPQLEGEYATPFRATVRDGYGNPVSGAVVTFRVIEEIGDSVVGKVDTTGSNGIAEPGSWRVGTVAGRRTIEATVGGLQGTREYHVAAGPFAKMAPVSPGFSWVRNSSVGFGFTTADRFGNGVAGIAAHATIISGGGSIAQPDQSNFLGDFGVSLNTPAAAGDVVIQAASPLAPDSVAQVTIHIRAPAGMATIGPDSQSVIVGDTTPNPYLVEVVDDAGDPVPDVPIILGAAPPVVTDSLGVAHLPYVPSGLGRGVLIATSPWLPGDSLVFVILGVRGPPHQIDAVEGPVPSGMVGQTLATGPRVRVRDKVGYAVAGVTVQFSTTRGTISGAEAVTDSFGIAYPTGWTLDTIAGWQYMTASVAGIPSLDRFAIAHPGPTTSLTVLPGPAPEGFSGEQLAVGIRVEGRDRYGNPAVGRTVTQQGVTLATGSPTPLVLDSAGRVFLTGWTLANAVGTAQLAVLGDSTSVGFEAAIRPVSPYHILLRGVPPEFDGVFRAAAYRWRRRITADVPNIPVNIPGGLCASAQGALSGTVDDIVIDVGIGAIDGPGGILGGAAPCFIRNADSLPLLGVMVFDFADLTALDSAGVLGDVVLHEMGHVLGIGSMWSFSGLLASEGSDDPQYTGSGGKLGWANLGGIGTNVPVEHLGGPGTADSHWRESTMPSELMTGFLSAAVNPMSQITVRSLADLGYTVDPTLADPYTLGAAPTPVPGRLPVRIKDRVERPRFIVDPDGTVRPIR